MSLERITLVKDALGLPITCPVITVAGTNGKGSTCAFLEAILIAAGYRVGCHTSPHLLRFNERARLQGVDASDDQLLAHFAAVEEARMRVPNTPTLTYFEFTTLAILHLFAQADLDVMILEVGMEIMSMLLIGKMTDESCKKHYILPEIEFGRIISF